MTRMVDYCIRDLFELGEVLISTDNMKWTARFTRKLNKELKEKYGKALAFDRETGIAWIV